MLLQLIKDGVVTELEDEVKLSLAPEHLNQIDQVRVLQVLQHADLAHRYLLDQWIVLGFLKRFGMI
jgi:hypothetical protein